MMIWFKSYTLYYLTLHIFNLREFTTGKYFEVTVKNVFCMESDVVEEIRIVYTHIPNFASSFQNNKTVS
jgi:hypothetical protein